MGDFYGTGIEIWAGFGPVVITEKEIWNDHEDGLQTPREEIVFTTRPKIKSQSQSLRYSQNIFCLPDQPNFSDFF